MSFCSKYCHEKQFHVSLMLLWAVCELTLKFILSSVPKVYLLLQLQLICSNIWNDVTDLQHVCPTKVNKRDKDVWIKNHNTLIPIIKSSFWCNCSLHLVSAGADVSSHLLSSLQTSSMYYHLAVTTDCCVVNNIKDIFNIIFCKAELTQPRERSCIPEAY